MNKFLKWLNDAGITTANFYFAFVTPVKSEPLFKLQTIQKGDGDETSRKGDSKNVKQYVIALDVFYDASMAQTMKDTNTTEANTTQ
ncbi:hypothetical protein Poli38472_004481 [Pythium oligandrum]|uniref:Uncharacterized protein n=1 Tax=Pythium oligandrum TaxID=41045 RepID=A0A8K1CBN8_PYTOL|nr:hypothetical protein Poli38472_004481 [Pythium oligandrum]|eukprot:TMW59412.1 hypothetical protein Poli38472_004481 [Pythium oligandrum]